MPSAKFWGDLYAGVGKKIGKLTANTLEETNAIAEGIHRAARKPIKSMFKPNDVEPNDIIELISPIKMKVGPQVVLGGAALTYGMAKGGLAVKNKRDMGYVSTGQMANTISPGNTPDIAQMTPEQERELKKDRISDLNTYGASGDIVFALNNMR